MTQALAARATSFGASCLVMGALVLAALTMTYTVRATDSVNTARVIDMVRPPAPPPPAPAAREPLRPPALAREASPLPPIEQEIRTSEPVPFSAIAPQSGPVEIVDPRWRQRPRNLASYYPSRALNRNVEGEVRLDCLVGVTGLLDCTVIAETPQGWGFAEAAQRIARAHRMIPATRDGAAIEGRYAMRVPFEIE